MLQATLPEIKIALSSKSRDLLSHVISECMQMRGRILERSGGKKQSEAMRSIRLFV